MFAHWYVVANQEIAKILVDDGEHQDLQVLHTLENPRGPEDQPSVLPNPQPHDVTATLFAKEIAGFLQNEKLSNHFVSLTIVAEPRFLGKLRHELNPHLLPSVTHWVGKDLHKTPIHELPERIGIELEFNKSLKKKRSVFPQGQQPPHE
jgi:protein required for attachment to host cells